ncbi:hypothetical protein, partial [Paenirhodobacter populi]
CYPAITLNSQGESVTGFVQQSRYMLPIVWKGSKKEIWQNLPGFEHRYAPLSDHVFDYFSANSSAFLGLKKDIKEAYLLSEILPALAHLDQFELSDLENTLMSERGGGYRWAPVAGKMGWDHWSTKQIFERLETEKFTAELAEAGFGNGNPKAVNVAAKHVRLAVANLHWQ